MLQAKPVIYYVYVTTNFVLVCE